MPFNGQVQYWAREWTVVEEYTPWYRAGVPTAAAAGHVTTYETPGKHQFKFVTVDGAGHEVPTYRPEAALTMLSRFVLNGE